MTAVNVCFVGVGSIATRHIVNLHAIFKARGRQVNIDCCRSGMHALPQELNGLIRNVFYAPEEVGGGYDMIFITNPTHMHLDAIRAFKDKSDCFFVEKPLCAPGQDVSVIGDVAQNPAKKVYIACPLRYTNVIRYIKNNIDLSKVYAVRGICSSYLPDWRAGSDYRNTYSAHKDMGGGVAVDLIHEWDYICDLFGKPDKVCGIIKKVSSLEIDSDDIAVYIADYGDKTVELHLDYFGRKPVRRIELFCRDDTVLGDLIAAKIVFQKSGETVDLAQARNDFQVRELEYFLDIALSNAPNTNDIEKAMEILRIAEGETI